MTVFMPYQTVTALPGNTTFVTLPNKKEIELGHTSRRHRPSPIKVSCVSPRHKWASESYLDDGTAAGEDEIEDVIDDDEDERGVVSFTTALKHVQQRMPERGEFDEGDTPGCLLGRNSEEPCNLLARR